jgi:3-isopropylmalate/(R)-2-methylmalate dehydratase large subunit
MIQLKHAPQTMLSKIWDQHVVAQEPESPAVLYVDLHLIHEVTSPQAFEGLRQSGRRVRRTDKTFATMDHSTPTLALDLTLVDTQAAAQVRQLGTNCEEFGVTLFDLDSERRGIVHIIGAELGLTQPGMTIVCGDSHTSTHGAFGALAFGVGTSEVEHVLATQCLLQNRPKAFEVRVDGSLGPAVTAKDIILAVMAKVGVDGGNGHVFEYTGPAIRGLDMEQRMTVCNMSIEAGARAGMVAPDDTTFEYLAGKEYAPSGQAWDSALERWSGFATDEAAEYDDMVTINAADLEPMITFGTNPSMGMPITDRIPTLDMIADVDQRQSVEKALRYMDLEPGQPLLGHPIDVVFIGSCTNSRISDLRLAAGLLNGRKVADGIRMLVVPGSQSVKRQAEAEGLHEIFLNAGAEWRESGCSMCLAMNGDELEPGQYGVSTSNRNYEGRQGRGGRTFLASPLTAAASAVMGQVADVRRMI